MRRITRDRKILELYKKGVKQAEIAKIFGLTRERIRQLIKEALDKKKSI
jgi:transcriptional regulator